MPKFKHKWKYKKTQFDLRIKIRKWKWFSQLNKQPKRLKKNLKDFRLGWESSPDVWDDRTQRSIQSSHLESRPLENRNIPVGGNDMNGNIWNDSFILNCWIIKKKNCGCLRYEELSTKYIYSFNPHLPTYVTSTIPNTSVSTCLTEKTSTKLFLWKEDV